MASENQIPATPKVAETKPSDLKDTVPQGEKLLSMLGYISFLCILPLAIKPNSKFCQFHGKQALVLAILFFFVSFIGGAIGAMIALIHIGVIIFCMITVANGKKLALPIISDFTKKLNW